MSASNSPPPTFFSLARELRDLIYFQLLHSVDHRPIGHNIQVSATDIPIARLLRINRKFKQEYQFASDQLSTLVISNHEKSSQHEEETNKPAPNTPLAAQLLPPSITRIPHITFSLIAPTTPSSSHITTTAGSALESLERWTDTLLAQFELKRIKSVSIEVEISPRAFSVLDFEGALLWSGNWTSLIRLKRLTVWREGGWDGNGSDEEDDESGLGGKRRRRRSLMLEWERERCRFGTRMKKTELPRNVWLNTQL